MNEKIPQKIIDYIDDENYIIYPNKDRTLVYQPINKGIGADMGIRIADDQSVFLLKNRKSVEDFFENREESNNMILDKSSILSCIENHISNKSPKNKIYIAINKKYQKDLREFFEKNIELINECFNDLNIATKNEKAFRIQERMYKEGLLEESQLNLIVNGSIINRNITKLFWLLNSCGELSERVMHNKEGKAYKEYFIRNINFNFLSYSAKKITKIPLKYFDFHIETIFNFLKEAKSKTLKKEIMLEYIRQYDNLSFFEKYASEIMTEQEVNECLSMSLNKFFIKEYIIQKPDVLLKLLEDFKDLKNFDEFLESKLSGVREEQRMFYLKIMNLDVDRFKPLFEKYNLLSDNNIIRKTYEIVEYELDLISLLSKNTHIKNYQMKISYVKELIGTLFDDVKVKRFEEGKKLFIQMYYTEEQKEEYKEKEKFLINDLFSNINDYVSRLNSLNDINNIKREIFLRYSLEQADSKKEVKNRKKL